MSDTEMMTNDQCIDYIIRGGKHYWHTLGNMRGSENHQQGNLQWVSGHFWFAYSVMLEGLDYEQEIEGLVTKVKNSEIPKSMMIFPDLSCTNIIELFQRYGEFNVESDYGMAKELYPSSSVPALPHNIELYRVNDMNGLKLAGSVLNAAFEYDVFSFENYIDLFGMPGSYFYLAECDGIPAGACLALQNDDFVEIAWVGTLKGYRKKGIAGYLMYMAEKGAMNNGKLISVLSAFPAAVGAYVHAGYRKCCDIKIIHMI